MFARAIGPAGVAFEMPTAERLTAADQVWVPHRTGGERLALAGMALGRPVVAADTPDLRAVLGDAAAYFPHGDRALLATVARRLFDRPAEAAALGEAGRQRAVAEFPAWQLADAVAAVYHEAAAPPAR
jgi:glycosyltransferase involved in cell wall biosynthesis